MLVKSLGCSVSAVLRLPLVSVRRSLLFCCKQTRSSPLNPVPGCCAALTSTCSLPQCSSSTSHLSSSSSSSSSAFPLAQQVSGNRSSLPVPKDTEKPLPKMFNILKVFKKGSCRRELPQTLGDVCHVCKKRVYTVERLRAEGVSFHRDCFRCDTCSTVLRHGGHSFDAERGKLYCKVHYSQRESTVKNRRALDLHKAPGGTVHTDPGDGPSGAESSQPAGTLRSVLRRSMCWPLHVGRVVCASPRRVARWLDAGARALCQHVRDNAEDYTYLYELLSVSVPLLTALHELVMQLWAEAGPLHPQHLQQWLEQHLGNWLLT